MNKTVAVAMSGGVDSSTTVILMQKEGYEVIGITLNLCGNDAVKQAKAVADELGIKHYTIDANDAFQTEVINYFAKSYVEGETPIPCIKCNQYFKFGVLLDKAKELGADFVATGHYSIIKNGRIYRGHDTKRDQSYFLCMLTSDQIRHIKFPLGEYTKDEVREIARQHGIRSSDTPDSQDVCFVEDGNYQEIVRGLYPDCEKKGDIISVDGRILGKHNGIINYTIGQRKGLGISSPTPLYVAEILPKTNEIIVGEREDLFSNEVFIRDVNLLTDNIDDVVEIKCRSTQPPVKAMLHGVEDGLLVSPIEPIFGIAKGQACAIYRGDELIGGGWIV